MSSQGIANLDRGKTWYNGRTIDVSSAYANLTDTHLEGQVKVSRNIKSPTELGTSDIFGTAIRNARDVKCVLVRNVSGITLLPGFMVTWKSGQFGKRVDGYSRLGVPAIVGTAVMAGMVDDCLPAAGVPDGDLFWLLVEGEALGYTPIAGTEFATDWAQGDILIALTAAASTGATTLAITGGRGQKGTTTPSATQTTDGTVLQIANYRFARVISAKTTGQTNARLLLDLKFF